MSQSLALLFSPAFCDFLRILIIAVAIYSSRIAAETPAQDVAAGLDNVDYSRLIGSGSLLLYGVYAWDYFSRTPHARYEGWFSAHTPEGGADKFGHMYLSHVLLHATGTQYEKWGYSRHDTGLEAAKTTLLLMGIMEVGDSFSDYGFSYEDLVMNVVGTAIGYKTFVNDKWSDCLDVRVEHSLEGISSDPFTDYERTKYLFALKLNGFDALKESPLRWMEIHLGYYARGYGDPLKTNSRTGYIGIGVNLTSLFQQKGWHRTATLLKFIQPPHMSINVERTWQEP